MKLLAALAAALHLAAPHTAIHKHAVSPRAYAGPCLASIIDREDPSWDPRRSNAQGSGAYGLPQALPGAKMSSAGRDWSWNPYTQIRWMRSYTHSRYGGECAALAFWNTHHYY